MRLSSEFRPGLRRHSQPTAPPRRMRRGVSLLPGLLTVSNLFCGWACIVYTLRGDYATAAPFIGIAFILDGLDGRIARMMGIESAFGREFDSLADIVSFGVAPAILVYQWGLTPFGRLGWAVGFIYVTAAAMRLARFNVQSGSTDKRFYVGMPSPAAAGVVGATVFAFPAGLREPYDAAPVVALVIVPALLMVSTIRFRSFKGIDLQAPRSYTVLLGVAVVIAAVFAHPSGTLLVLAYAYLLSTFVELGVHRLRRRRSGAAPVEPVPDEQSPSTRVG